MTTPGTPPDWMRQLNQVLTGFRTYRNGTRGFDTAALGACRRGLRREPMSEPKMWTYIAAVRDTVPPQWGNAVTDRIEAATHHVLALYAFHQQSKDQPMHLRDSRNDRTLGAGCRQLRAALDRRGRTAEGAERRFYAAVTADTLDELIGHLRGLIPLLREHSIPLDYVQLARDLADWPDPDRRARIRRRWGLDYLHTNTTTNTAAPAEPVTAGPGVADKETTTP